MAKHRSPYLIEVLEERNGFRLFRRYRNPLIPLNPMWDDGDRFYVYKGMELVYGGTEVHARKAFQEALTPSLF